MKLVFLDFDGVLHPDAVYQPRNGPLELRAPGELFQHAPILEEMLADHPDVKIILSTSWVRLLRYSRTLKKMPEGLRARVIGATWHSGMAKPDGSPYRRVEDPFNWLTRFQQIEWYVKRHEIEHWLAIDDLHSGEEIDKWPFEQRHRLVLTDPDKGLGCPMAQEDLRTMLWGLKCLQD